MTTHTGGSRDDRPVLGLAEPTWTGVLPGQDRTQERVERDGEVAALYGWALLWGLIGFGAGLAIAGLL